MGHISDYDTFPSLAYYRPHSIYKVDRFLDLEYFL